MAQAKHQFRSSIKFSSSTIIGNDEQNTLKQLIRELKFNDSNKIFCEPVDYKVLKIDDYPYIIQYPMDLSTVSEKLQHQKYELIEECLDDIQIIFDNCCDYNTQIDFYFSAGEKFIQTFHKLIRNYFPYVNFQKNPISTSLKDKCYFNLRLRNLTESQLNIILEDIYRLCPQAIEEQENNKEYIYIQLDKIEKVDFKFLNEKMTNLIQLKITQTPNNSKKE